MYLVIDGCITLDTAIWATIPFRGGYLISLFINMYILRIFINSDLQDEDIIADSCTRNMGGCLILGAEFNKEFRIVSNNKDDSDGRNIG